ncbi:hypothetical protein [Burkholderia pseudomallei]|uniref:hypothetical protein n=1 Tax=Burkholderia pseudomallei TaxID=28450 RepID=UPI000F07B0D0|nr:hypothetical protein [Burkholderia pseudomallei]
MVTVIANGEVDLTAAFLASDVRTWFHRVVPGLVRDAEYVCSIKIDGISFDFSVLVVKKVLGSDDNRRLITLEAGRSDTAMSYHSEIHSCEVELLGLSSDISTLDWPETENPVLAKVAVIAKSRPRMITPNFAGKGEFAADGTPVIVMKPTN